MSHYRHLTNIIDEDYLKFMQNNTEELLLGIENKDVSADLLKRKGVFLEKLHMRANGNKAIILDLKRFAKDC